MNDKLSVAQQFTGLPMADLIGGPLSAVSTANSQMALTQTKFLLDTCFEFKEEDKSYKPIMIDMVLTRGVISYNNDGSTKIDSFDTKFSLPLLTIVPINSLGIDSTSIHFEMEVKSSSSETEEETSKTHKEGEVEVEGKVGWGPISVSIKGKASYSSDDSKTHDTHYENSNSAKYVVDVHASQLPLPKGVNTIIDAFSQNISPVQIPDSQSGDKNNSNKSKNNK